jgi:hypothetical protein
MVMGANMKKILFVSLFIFSVFACAEPTIVFKTKLNLNNKCNIKSTNKNGKVEIVKVSLPESSNCSFIMHDETNLINIKRITNSYMLFVQSPYEHNGHCMSKYTAIVIKNDGTIQPSNFIKRSGTCPTGVEQKEFEYFAYKMNILK